MLVLLIALRPPASALLRRFGSLPSVAYGIYFCHLLPIKICESLATRRGLSMSWQLDLDDLFRLRRRGDLAGVAALSLPLDAMAGGVIALRTRLEIVVPFPFGRGSG